MDIVGIIFMILALVGLAATGALLPNDGYGFPRHRVEDWRDPRA